jgi:hypothetical protein
MYQDNEKIGNNCLRNTEIPFLIKSIKMLLLPHRNLVIKKSFKLMVILIKIQPLIIRRFYSKAKSFH